jgi:hypothetical protein
MNGMKLGSLGGYHFYGEGGDLRFYRILAIRRSVDFVPKAQKTLAPHKIH